MTTPTPNTSLEKATRIAKVKGRAICPKGHRAPRVQYLADEELYCCTTCAITWKAIFEITIPAEVSAEKWAQMALAAPDMLSALKAARELLLEIERLGDDGGLISDNPDTLLLITAAIAKAGGQ